MQKMTNKCLKHLRSVNMGLEKDNSNLVHVINVLCEVQTICLSTIKFIVAYLSLAKAEETGHSLVFKLMHSKCISY